MRWQDRERQDDHKSAAQFFKETQEDGHQTRIAQAFLLPCNRNLTKTDTPASSQEISKATRPPLSFNLSSASILPTPLSI